MNKLLSLLAVTVLRLIWFQPLAGQTADASGTWVDPHALYCPWTVRLTQEASKLTGARQQVGGPTGPADIYEGSINGKEICFKCDSPGGARAIASGAIDGDTMKLKRSTKINRQEASGNGLFGAAAAPAQAGPAGRWQATAVPNGPWTFEFAVAGDSLTGMIQQQGAPSAPISISAGKAFETTISFKVLSPDGERIIDFKGRVSGDEISFIREISPLPGGTRGGNDLYGGSAPLQFVASRAASNH